MYNSDIKNYAFEKGVYLWQIANELGIADTTFSKKMRKPFTKEKKKKFLKS